MSSVSEVSGGVSALLVEQQAPDSKKEVTADGAKVPKLSSSLETLKEILVKGGEKEAVLKSLSEVFGKKVIDKVLQLPMKIPGQMGRKECLELLVQVGQQVTLEDLEELFQEIKQCEGRGLIALSEIPTLRLWWNTSVRNLPEFWIAHLLRLFRDPLSFLEFERKLELQAQLGDIIEKDRDRAAVLYYEEQARTLGEKGNRLAPEFFYSYREILAKDLAYVRHPYFPIGSVVPV
ncbi:MAG: hypothetical protein KDK60_03375, partial [Chlamydiia bacterium]|nr:hypothetical protein [Chlamydiia bacterium]